LTPGETALTGVLIVAACVGVFLTARTPIPIVSATEEEGILFLKQLFLDRELTPDPFPQMRAAAPFAVVLHLIRSGEPAVARRAIEFAAESDSDRLPPM
jgi:hypothetical protein